MVEGGLLAGRFHDFHEDSALRILYHRFVGAAGRSGPLFNRDSGLISSSVVDGLFRWLVMDWLLVWSVIGWW